MQEKINTRPEVELKAMIIGDIKQDNIFTIYRVYNGWIYIHMGSLNQTFVFYK